MNEKVTNELIYEVLKSLQDGQRHILQKMTTLEEELRTHRSYLHALQGDMNSIHFKVGTLGDELNRVRTRLGLTEPPH